MIFRKLLPFLFCITILAAERVTPEEAWNLGWPTFQGPDGNCLPAQTETELVDDLADARLVWESETNVIGRAKHTTGAFKGSTAESRLQKVLDILGPGRKTPPGSWASPIIAEGKLFMSTFRPAGKLYDVKPYDFKSDPQKRTAKAHLEAEDLLVALDVGTGKVLWETAGSGGFIWGVGKRMGFQVTPVYRDGVVYSMGTTGRVFAHSAMDGKKLWETAPLEKMLEEKAKYLQRSEVYQVTRNYGWQQSLVFAGGTVVVPRGGDLQGLDPEDGSVRWELSRVVSRWVTPAVWKKGCREYLLCPTYGKPGEASLNLVDAEKGSILWTVGGLDSTQFNLSPAEDVVLVNVGSQHLHPSPNASAPKNPKGEAPYGRLGAYKLTLEGAEKIWEFPDEADFLIPTWSDTLGRPRYIIREGLVYFASGGEHKKNGQRFIIARADTGEVLTNEPRQNDYWYQLMGDKLLHSIDWAHGKSASFNLYDSRPEEFKILSGPWRTKEPLTTCYQVFMEPPVIDGRIFWRTENGTVVCYDLRKVKE